jgi:hypothetical protein
MEYDFTKLTAAQEWLICYQGWRIGQKYPDGSPWPQPSKRTVKKLIERGLVQAVQAVTPDRFMNTPITVTEYRVEPDVHLAWCFSYLEVKAD